eukprot:symbB.v1.2.030215.t1/scaffold3380.1/size79486/1
MLLVGRFPPARASDDDARSDASWTTVRTSEVGEAETLGAGADQHQGRGMDPIAEEVKNVPPPPATQKAWGNPTPPSAAPVNQAARNLLDHANEPPAARRLRRQQEKAERRGCRGIRYGQMGAHNACNAQLPAHIRQVGSQAGERSVLILDSRDHPMQSPFQGRLLDEILTNANTMLNVVSDASQVKLEGDLLLHLELRGYRSDHDMSVQICHVADTLLWSLEEKPFIPTFVVTVFQGWRVIACSWEVGGRLYALSENGVVVALDFPLCHIELRLVTSSSPDAFGLDADRLEFRFYSGSDRLNVACSTCSVPPTWLVVSRVSGPTLIKNAQWCRDHYARVESPDQTLHLSQLASVHAHWTVSVEAAHEEETGPRISAVSVQSNPKNMHLIAESPLFRKEKAIVAREALAVQAHDVNEEVVSAVLPPITGGPAVQPVAAMSNPTRSHKISSLSLSLETLHEKAWNIRRKIVSRVQGVPISENLVKLWESTMEDVQEGSCVGPLGSEQEVSDLLKVDDWIPTQRFEVVQKNKVRGCDSATTNLINRATVITEKLQLPSTDTNVAALRALRSEAPLQQLGGWVLDEKEAYREVPIRPDQRKFSVIALKNPFSGVPSFFVMVGHSFGLVSAVYNYNRRSAAINEFSVSLFGLVAFSFYDDKYGFEPLSTVQSAHEVAQQVHWWLGAHFDQKKLQLARDPTILGVTYNLIEMTLEIKESRKKDLLEEMDSILESKLLDPGTAGKLKGKLMFGASQLWNKVGRAFLRSISERQYARFALQIGFKLDQALEVSFRHWKKLISEGPPRPIELMHQKISDAVIFTDGFTPDPRSKEKSPSMVGAVLFDRRMSSPLQLSEVVPRSMEERWLPRKTQVVPVEMLAPILALQTFYDRLRGADIILLIDSEAVEAALIKGYSSKEDLCSLVSVFWDLVFELRARVFIDRVATDANPSGMPSRGDVRTGEAVGWRTVKAVWPRALLGNRA